MIHICWHANQTGFHLKADSCVHSVVFVERHGTRIEAQEVMGVSFDFRKIIFVQSSIGLSSNVTPFGSPSVKLLRLLSVPAPSG